MGRRAGYGRAAPVFGGWVASASRVCGGVTVHTGRCAIFSGQFAPFRGEAPSFGAGNSRSGCSLPFWARKMQKIDRKRAEFQILHPESGLVRESRLQSKPAGSRESPPARESRPEAAGTRKPAGRRESRPAPILTHESRRPEGPPPPVSAFRARRPDSRSPPPLTLRAWRRIGRRRPVSTLFDAARHPIDSGAAPLVLQ